MKVILINPPNSVDQKISFTVNVFQPLGLAYIAAVLEKNHYQVKILDALAEGFDQEKVIGSRRIVGLSYSDIKKEIRRFQPDIVGIATPFSFQSLEAHKVADLVKQVNQQIITVTGGSHPTIQPEEMLKNKNVDYVIRGEGEYIMLDLIRAIEGKKSLRKIKSLSYRDNKGQIINNPRSEPIKDLDNLPFPARYLLPMEKYHQAAKKGRVTEGLIAYGKKRTSIVTSRGCPFNCTFCTVHLIMTRVWRARSPKNVLEELKECKNKYGIEYFDIIDDNFTLIPERAKEICRLMIKEDLQLEWSTPNGVRADKLDEELITLMKKAGCISIKVAPESGNQEVLNRIIKKNLDLKKIKKAIVLCKKHQLPIEAFFVVGFPQETEKDIQDTINYAKELRQLGCDYCYFFIATPYFGTEMYRIAVAKGYLDELEYRPDEIYTMMGKSIMKNPNLPPEKLDRLLKIAGRVNPLFTKNRLLAGLRMIYLDPLRISKFGLNYIKNFLP